MRNYFFTAAVALTVLLPVRLLVAQWSPGSGRAVAQQVDKQVDQGYKWVKNPRVPGEVYLYRDGRQVGGYSYHTGFYLPLVNGEWGPPAKAPIPPPLEGLTPEKSKPLFGVVTEKISPIEHFECRDRVHNRESAYALLEATVPDDGATPFLSCISRDQARAKQIAREWDSAAPLAPYKKSWRAQFYDSSSPVTQQMLAPFRLDANTEFQKSGLVFLAQGPPAAGDGRARVQQWANYTTPEALAEVLRKVDPNFDPNKSPLPSLPELPRFSSEELVLAGAGVCVLLLFLFRPRRS